MKKNYLIVIFIVVVMVGIFLGISPLVEKYYLYKFDNHLKINPDAVFEFYYDAKRVESDKDFLYACWALIGLFLLLLAYVRWKLFHLKKRFSNPPKKPLALIFFGQLVAYLGIVGTLFVSSVMFFDFLENILGEVGQVFLGMFCFLNAIIWLPHFSTRGIVKGAKISTTFQVLPLILGIVFIPTLIMSFFNIKLYALSFSLTPIVLGTKIFKKWTSDFKELNELLKEIEIKK